MKIFDKLYIDGQFVPAEGGMLDVINPADESIAGRAPLASAADVDRAIQAARRAFGSWSSSSAHERAGYIRKLVAELTRRREQMAELITAEMGAPLWFSQEVQVDDPIDALAQHAEHASLLEQEVSIGNCTAVREPVGVCAFINPWNYPLHQLIGKMAPALAAGCTMVLKPSENTPLHGFLLAEAVHAAGLPAGVFNLVNGDGPSVGEPLCTHPEVDMVSFTGSTRAGVRIAQLAAPTVKRVCQELGGKSPLLIAEDADLEAAVQFGVEDVMVNSGQTCTALTRMLVPASRYEDAIAIAKQHAESLKLGDPNAEDTFIGPLASKAQLEVVQRYIGIGLEEGARLVTGGLEPPEGLLQGYYARPTIFADVSNDMTIAREEIFGPVLSMIPYDGEADAIRIANDTPYGLSARVWSSDRGHARALARQIRAGQVYINNGDWNNQAPFGGYKQSGNGRELGEFGVHEFFETKALIG
ncbi:aldehyde dehydrogenase family protein [Motiliproteus coralliicola]|uniref:Aldehyde dehydrogenase family protein n=1 Tax=Motiliproteus coralliicola TaxID=2283196 RepID=A0A369WSG8_9GAMM|nr:aldehyde dehydrogenase family protein [Motiliproteus coralliicola]RDE24617.1 aldehyde dehydrogenase family protein [Motiliproteus coralliicola]